MAKVKLSPILTGMHGRLGSVVFYQRQGRDCVRVYLRGRDPDTGAQKAVRRTFGDAVRLWQMKTPEDRSEFNRKARSLNMSGYNLHISLYMKSQISGMQDPGLENKTPEKVYSSLIQRRVASVSPPFTKAFHDSMPPISLKRAYG